MSRDIPKFPKISSESLRSAKKKKSRPTASLLNDFWPVKLVEYTPLCGSLIVQPRIWIATGER